MTHDVFISYKRGGIDEEIVGHLAACLAEKGLSVFRDTQGLIEGDDFNDTIFYAARDSIICVFVLSPRWAESWYCFRELIAAKDNALHMVFPIILGNMNAIEDTVTAKVAGHTEKLSGKLKEITLQRSTVMDAYKWLVNRQGRVVLPTAAAQWKPEIQSLADRIKVMVNTMKSNHNVRRPTFILKDGDDPYKLCKREFGNGMLYRNMTYEGRRMTDDVAQNLPVDARLVYHGKPEFVLAPKDNPYAVCQRAYGDGKLYKKLTYDGKYLTQQLAKNLPDGALLVYQG